MDKKKKIILGVSLVFVGLITMIVSLSLGISSGKLKGDVSGTDVGLNIVCEDENLEIGESTNCTLSANTGTYTIATFTGAITSSSNITLSNLQKGTGWETNDSSNFSLSYYRMGKFDAGTVTIASFTATANANGTGYVKIGKLNGELFMTHVIDDYDEGTMVPLSEKQKSITVGGSDEPVLSNDASLTSIIVNNQEIISTKRIEVPNSVAQVTISTTTSHPAATVQNDGLVDLSVGENPVKLIVTAEDRTTTRDYDIVIVRADGQAPDPEPHSDYLTSLSISPGSLNETFSSDVYNYTANVANSVERITVSATCSNPDLVIPNTPYDLNVGENTILITLAAPDTVPNEYRIIVTRASDSSDDPDDPEPSEPSSDTSISSITVDGTSVDLSTMKLTVEYENNDFVNIVVTPTDSNARVTGKIGSQAIKVGQNVLTFTVKAEDNETTREYTLTITRKDKSGDDDTTIACTLSSDVYTIDNDNLKVKNVDLNHSNDTIKNNLKASCGTINVSDDKVIITNGDTVRTYSIERIWFPKTGNNKVAYGLIFGGLVLLIGIALLYRIKVNKDEK